MSQMATGDMAVEVTGQDRSDEVGSMARMLETLRNSLQAAEQLRLERSRTEGTEREALARRTPRRIVSPSPWKRSAGDPQVFRGDGREREKPLDNSGCDRRGDRCCIGRDRDDVAQCSCGCCRSGWNCRPPSREINTQVSRSAQIAGDAAQDAAHTADSVKALTEAAGKIGDVVNLISDIAEQTNLLALNATIEGSARRRSGQGALRSLRPRSSS